MASLHIFAGAQAVPSVLAWLKTELAIAPSDIGFLLLGPADDALSGIADTHGLKGLKLADAVLRVPVEEPVIVAGADMDERIGYLFSHGLRNVYNGNALLQRASAGERFMDAAAGAFVGPTPPDSRDIGAIEAMRFPVEPMRAGQAPQHKLFIVNSMPKSGTIWLIAMLERILGVRGRPQVVLSHVADIEADWNKPNNHGAVLLARDIRDVVVSWYHHAARSDIQMGFAEPRYRSIETFYREFFLGKIYGSDRYYRGDLETWLNRASASYVPIIRYEQLVPETARTLAKVLNAWRVDHDPTAIERVVADCAFDAMRETASHDEGYVGKLIRSGHLRKGRPNGWKDELPPDIAADLHRRFIGYQTRLGYEG